MSFLTRHDSKFCAIRSRGSKPPRMGSLVLVAVLIAAVLFFGHGPVSSSSNAASKLALVHENVVQQEQRDGRTVNSPLQRGDAEPTLTSKQELATSYSGPPELQQVLEQNLAQPLSLTAADFDEDGVPDLISGYQDQQGGLMTLRRGNIGSLGAFGKNTGQDRLVRSGESEAADGDSPFLVSAEIVALPSAPDFLDAGDFNADGHADLVVGQRGGNKLAWLAGDGRGRFQRAGESELPGALTALAVGELNRPDGLPEVVMGIATKAGGGQVLVLEGPNGAGQATTEVFAMSAPVSGLALGALDGDAMPDLAVAAGREMVLIAGRDRMLSLREEDQAKVVAAQVRTRVFQARLRDVALGDFTGDGRLDLVALTTDGKLRVLTQTSAKKRLASADWPSEVVARGKVWAGTQRLITARLTDLPMASIIGVSNNGARARVVQRETLDGAATRTAKGRLRLNATRWAEKELSESSPVALLPLRINGDALDDLVMLQAGANTPIVIASALATIFTVNSSADTDDGACNASNCTLREAINVANANSGLDEVRFNIPAVDSPNGEGRGTGLPDGDGSRLEPSAFLPEIPIAEATTAADGDLDASFNPSATINGRVNDLALQQPDSKVIIGGEFSSINGLTRNNIARLNVDGTLDTTFGNGQAGANNFVLALAVQGDGKVVIGGGFTSVNGVARRFIARLNADGTLDTNFIPAQVDSNGGFVSDLAVQPDGKVVVVGYFTSVNGMARNRIVRLNMDGTLDTSFGNGLEGANSLVFALSLQSGGKVIIGGLFTAVNGVARNNIARLNADGTLDTTFGNGQAGADGGVEALSEQADGKVIIGGGFSSINGITRRGIARLNADGTLDTTFGNGQDGANSTVYALALQADGKVVIGGGFSSVNGVRNSIARLNADGTLDTTFGNGQSGTDQEVFTLAVQADGKVVIGGRFISFNGAALGGIVRLSVDGTLDATFGNGQAGVIDNGTVEDLALKDGKVVIGGRFTSVNGIARNRIARLNADGTLDTSFGNGLVGANSDVYALAVQPDGKVVIGGNFTSVNGVARNFIARLNADGTLDTSFINGLAGLDGHVYALAVQLDGKVVIGGDFTTVNGVARNRFARLNANGTLDTTFGDGLTGVSGGNFSIVWALAVQADGKVVIGGDFSGVNGVARNNIARLNANGALDTTFGDGLDGANFNVYALEVQGDGKVVIGGYFSFVNGMVRTGIARLNTDGTLDANFGNGQFGTNGSVQDLAVQPDGKVVIGGNFTSVNGVGRNNIARLNTDGTLDTAFGDGQDGANFFVNALAVQLDGKIIIGGDFSSVNGIPRNSVARLFSGKGSLQFSSAVYSANENAGTAIMAVIREGSAGPASVNYATAVGGTATGGMSCGTGVDYLNTSGTVTWADGESGPKTFVVPICDDSLAEGNETVNLILSNPSGAPLFMPNATLTIVDNSCSYAISPTQANILASGGNGSVNITAGVGCPWTVSSNAPTWLSVQSGTSGSGNGLVTFTAQPNTGLARSGTLIIGGQTFTVFQDGGTVCSYAASPLIRRFDVAGGNGMINIFSVPGSCPWTATSNNPSFLTVTNGASGTGSGPVNFSVSSNSSGSARAGTITINGGANFTRVFNIVQGASNSNRRTINLSLPLPQILDPIIIDGSTQPGFAGVPLIEINGQNLGAQGGGDGLYVSAGNSTLRSLILSRFGSATRSDSAIVLITNGNNVVEGCYVGSDTSGTNSFTPTPQRDSAIGINIRSSSGNRIGGTTVAQRNLISGVDGRGVVISDSATGNLVQGNYIGTDITGSVSLGLQSIGVNIRTATGNTIGGTTAGAGNLISGNLAYGVFLQDDAQNNLVQGNLIGTNGTGVAAVANGEAGVFLYRPSGPVLNTMNTVGGTTAPARNVISGNGSYGVAVGAGATSTMVQGNYIGTDNSGTSALPNSYGVIATQATGSTIGGAVDAARNVISGNTLTGVSIGFLNSGQVGGTGTTIQRNYIGTNASGDGALGNLGDGVFVEVQSITHTIQENVIAFNGANGVRIPDVTPNPGTPGLRIQIVDNSIYSNVALAIDLGSKGITPNDPGDADAGANLLQNFPELSSAVVSAGTITVTGMMKSTPNTTFTLHWYFTADPACVAHQATSRVLEKNKIPVTTDSNGNGPFSLNFGLPVGISNGIVNCTATDPQGNTSEYSECLLVPQWRPVVLTEQQIMDMKAWTVGGKSYGYVKPEFSDAGYRVVNWGQVGRSGTDFTVDASVEKFTSSSIQSVVSTAQIYELGVLTNGSYNFSFKTSGTLARKLPFTVSATVPPPNPIDIAREFVKQQYRDFLNREPDQAGEDFWTDNITKCSDLARRPAGQSEAQCRTRQMETTSGAFFQSPEFQYTGYYVYRMYQGALGRQPKLSEFTPDAQFVVDGIIVNGHLSATRINQNKAAFAQQFVNCTDGSKYRCAEFKAIYDGMSNQQYLDKLFQKTGVTASAGERAALVDGLNANPATETRASVLQKVVDGINVIAEGNQQFTTTYGQAFYNNELNRAFVQLEYFAYLKRDPDEAGYTFWLGKLNQFGGSFVNAEMVLAFISSPEYRARFGQP